jgi:hypothetical protein
LPHGQQRHVQMSGFGRPCQRRSTHRAARSCIAGCELGHSQVGPIAEAVQVALLKCVHQLIHFRLLEQCSKEPALRLDTSGHSFGSTELLPSTGGGRL